ncbi:MAG: aspartate/glutamate racemase family protein [Desulfotignum sp.]|nr:aspartate/glutamate racemase family protein [Desulfotignum sp.]MCF8089147.1 aspartate/glutamate racemase family protein [Desulfotignum sp.]MCF8138642.1 aspartate/glutamate racemase family protein [Desulfotignum sp.]
MTLHPKAGLPSDPFMGILMLDTTFPRIIGDIGNPQTFDFPVRYCTVKGATPERIVVRADKAMIQPFVAAGRDLIREGAVALATSCGFLALFHKALVAALPVPVFSSSLLQVLLAQTLLQDGQKVGILTARKGSLGHEHLSAIGIADIPMAIQGMEDFSEFTRVFIQGKTTLDVDLCRNEMASAALNLITRHPRVGPIVLECANMPPFADAVRQVTQRPVFDITTLLNSAWAGCRR